MSTTSQGQIHLTIGGILDNTVGFLYLPQGVEAPQVTPVDMIYLEHVMDRWYVFKTT